MIEQYTPRENIADYLVELESGHVLLLKSPVDWKEGEEVRKVDFRQTGVDVNALCDIICERLGITEVTYAQMYHICEYILQTEESGKEVFPK